MPAAARRLQPMFAGERSAAALLDMQPSEFRRLVEVGALPRPRRIGNLERWDTAELYSIIRGDITSADEFEP